MAPGSGGSTLRRVLQAQGLAFQCENLVGCVVFVQNSRSLVGFRAEVAQGMCFFAPNSHTLVGKGSPGSRVRVLQGMAICVENLEAYLSKEFPPRPGLKDL